MLQGGYQDYRPNNNMQMIYNQVDQGHPQQMQQPQQQMDQSYIDQQYNNNMSYQDLNQPPLDQQEIQTQQLPYRSPSATLNQQAIINNQSIEQLRYQERLRMATQKQNETYHRFISTQNNAMTSKDKLINKYDQLEQMENIQPQLLVGTPQRKTRLGKIVTQIEMNNPETRKYLREVLEQQIKEKNQRKQNEIAQHKVYQQGIKHQSEINAQEQLQTRERKRMSQHEYKQFLDAQKTQPVEQYGTYDQMAQDLMQQQQQLQYQPPALRYDQSNNYNILSGQNYQQELNQMQRSTQLPPRPGQVGPNRAVTQQYPQRNMSNVQQYTNPQAMNSQPMLPPLQNNRTPMYNHNSMTPNMRNKMQGPPTDQYSMFQTLDPQNNSGLQYAQPINLMQPRAGSANLGERRNSQQYFSNLAARNLML
ncbi:UNKNOWN [Stylonychia lemnae]|uniref:Uncharacterized protein n=1 Tax=Stylonychia lemnae TaxID=5949 RepID=A0A077ZUS9_STYLE|nr:UNKNOWN [Stylonychia lemnae]|eukprot:CDW73060.1 UNKNOWN [Stylonychia lemnae]